MMEHLAQQEVIWNYHHPWYIYLYRV